MEPPRWPGADPDRPLDEASRALLEELPRDLGGLRKLAYSERLPALALFAVAIWGLVRFGFPLALDAASVSLRDAIPRGTLVLIWAVVPLVAGVLLWKLAVRRELARAKVGDLVDLLFAHLARRSRSRAEQVASRLFARTAGNDLAAAALGRALAATVMAEVSRDSRVARQWATKGGEALSVVARDAPRTELLQCLEAACRRRAASEGRPPAQARSLVADVLAEVMGGVLAAVVGGAVVLAVWFLLASPFGSHHEGVMIIVMFGPCLGATLGAPIGVYLAGRARGWRSSLWLLGVCLPVIGVAVSVIGQALSNSAAIVLAGPVLALVLAVLLFHGTRHPRAIAPPADRHIHKHPRRP